MRGRVIDVCLPAAALCVYTPCLFFCEFIVGPWSFFPQADTISMCICLRNWTHTRTMFKWTSDLVIIIKMGMATQDAMRGLSDAQM